MARSPSSHESTLVSRITAAFFWIAAFSFASGLFLASTMALRLMPPTAPIAVGVVTILRYPKTADYVGAALFMFGVPLLTIWLRNAMERLFDRQVRSVPQLRGTVPAVAAWTLPFLLSPLLYLTTGKLGWVIVLPPAIAFVLLHALRIWRTSTWLRSMFAADLASHHALLFCGATGWLLFRYIATGRRVAHVPTLLLEITFVTLLLAAFWATALLVARIAELSFGRSPAEAFQRVAAGASVLAFLPLLAFIEIPTRDAGSATIAAILIGVLIAAGLRAPLSSRTAWKIAAYALLPLLIYCLSYGSGGGVSQWIDLFHRGETIGPASDYLRGKVPYRDTFPLHGMLEDGVLDAWLMQLFGRSLAVSVARSAILGGLLAVSLWYLGIAVFSSMPLAGFVVVMGAWTTAENDRTFFQIAAATLLWVALVRRRRLAAVGSGIFAGLAFFHSYDIGLYTIGGAVLVCITIAVARRWASWDGLEPVHALFFFGLGSAIAAAPFLVFLAAKGAVGSFFETTFVVIPKIIDPVWSLPFPDIVSTFRGNNLNLHTLADFVLFEKFHLILSPVAIAIALIVFIDAVRRHRIVRLHWALLLLTLFAAITQRTAFGRAEFRHQYFAAFLVGPIIVVLVLFAARRMAELWREGGEGTRAFVVLAVLCVIPLAGVLFWIPDLINARLDDLVNYQRRAVHSSRNEEASTVEDRIGAVSGYVRTLLKRNEPVYDFSNQPALYFFIGHPNPTRFYQVPIASPAQYQAEIIRDLERAKPGVVLRTSPENYDEMDQIPNALRAPAVAAYIDDMYSFDRAVRGIEVWIRRRNARPAAIATYLRRVRIPDDVVPGVRERMLFPVVGTTPGANGSYWVSDLTLHNPRRDPIDLSLRFVVGDTRIDRHVTLSPRQTVRWPNTVQTLFGLQSGLGTLWIGFRSGRMPVAVVKTSDVAHGGRASIETPLTRADVGVEGADTAELTIVGIPEFAVSQRRLSIGIVNPGIVPAKYRVSVRSRTGVAIGNTVEEWVPEDELFVLRNPEQVLGVDLDESTTVMKGTGVAFASYVDASGGTELIPAVPAQQQ